jgi:hypothetical protein
MKYLLLILLLSLPLPGGSRYAMPCRADLIYESGRVTIAQKNILEQGHNRGLVIEKYLRSVGLKPGYPYCNAGLYWCWLTACRNLGLATDEIPVPKSGLAISSFYHAKKFGLRTAYFPECNDLIIWRKGRSVYGHVERIILKYNHGWVRTVGFNTTSREGNKSKSGVFIKTRNIYAPLGRLKILGLVGFKPKVL